MKSNPLFLSAVLAATASATLPVVLPPCLEEFKPFAYSGCFRDQGNSALAFDPRLSRNNMTVAKCIAECKGNGYRYAGLEYYGECFCGATVNGEQIEEAECNTPCTGDKSENCGGNNALSIYQDPTFPKNPDEVTVEDYVPLGCYTDSSEKGRALARQIKVEDNTNPKCLAACKSQGYPFAGTQYGSECWCGVVLANDTAKVDDSECNIPCPGDASTNCGGSFRLTFFVAKELESLEPCGTEPEPSTTTTIVVTPTTTEKPTSTEVPTTTEQPPTTSEETTTSKVPETTTSNGPETTTSKGPETTTSNGPETTTSKGPETTTENPQTTTTRGYTTTRVYTTTTSTRRPTTSTQRPHTTTWVTKTKSTTKGPEPTGCPKPGPICVQPSSIFLNIHPGQPVCGIELPTVDCKNYDPNAKEVCAEACKIQYDGCLKTGFFECLFKREEKQSPNHLQARTFGLLHKLKCKGQYDECLKQNQGVDAGRLCKCKA